MATKRPPPRSRASRAPVDPVEARAVVDAFFDALGHFAGEPPAIEDLMRVLSPDAEILDGVDGEEHAGDRYARDDWFAYIEGTSEPELGQFFEEVERTVTDCSPEVQVGSVVEERVTRGGTVERVDTLRCALLVSRVGDRASIVRVRVRRSSRPPSGAGV